MADIVGIFSSLFDKLERLGKLQEDMKNIESKELIADLRNDLADLKLETAKLKEENQRLGAAVKRKGLADGLREMLEFRNSVYVLKQDAKGFKRGTAFCPRCLENDERPMPLTEMPDVFQAIAKYKCNECDKKY